MTVPLPNDASSPPGGARGPVRRMLISVASGLSLALLSGCATLMALPSQVSTYGDWPAGRSPGTFAFDRLPSQAGQADVQARLEAAAAPALQHAGFTEAAAGAESDVRVEISARLVRMELGPFADGRWWPGFGVGVGSGGWRGGPGVGWSMGMGLHTSPPRFEREVMLLIRDRTSGRPLYEARATSEGATPGDAAIVRAMFEAALARFPATDAGPRTVTVPLRR